MVIMEMVGQSGILTVLGMSIVFFFFLVMIVSVSIMSKTVLWAVPAKKEQGTESGQQSISTAPDISSQIAAAIGAALGEYRKNPNQG